MKYRILETAPTKAKKATKTKAAVEATPGGYSIYRDPDGDNEEIGNGKTLAEAQTTLRKFLKE